MCNNWTKDYIISPLAYQLLKLTIPTMPCGGQNKTQLGLSIEKYISYVFSKVASAAKPSSTQDQLIQSKVFWVMLSNDNANVENRKIVVFFNIRNTYTDVLTLVFIEKTTIYCKI